MIKKIISLYIPYKKYIFISCLFMVIVGAIYSFALYLIKFVVDDVLINKNISMLSSIVITVFVLYIIRSIALFYQNYFVVKISNSIVADIRKKFFEFILNSSYSIFIKHPQSKLLSILTNDIETIQRSTKFLPLSVFGDTLKLIFLSVLIFKLNFKLSLLSMLVIPIASYPIYVFSNKLRKSGKKSLEEMSKLYSKTLESVYAYILIYILDIKNYILERFLKQSESYKKVYTKFGKYEALTTPVMDFIGIIGVSFLLYVGGIDVINGKWTTGEFFSFIMAVFAFYAPIKSFSQINVHIQLAIGAMNRIEEVLAFKTQLHTGTKKPEFERYIEFQSVDFKYNGSFALRSINLKICPNEKIAVVGPTGSGKTTLINTLLGFHKPISGRIFIDGIDLEDVDLEHYRKLFSIVPQDVIIFDLTIKENILLNRYDEKTLFELIEKMSLKDFFYRFPYGLNTYVGERGYSLSGGEKQIISILRALLKMPKILIMDEATSNLDSNLEFKIIEAINDILPQATIIQIAHRFSSIKNVSRVIVMEAGTIIEDDERSKLLTKDGLFKSLFEKQII
ncbi:MAG: ABC transporter ATP-binding protein/permease [bacterium]|nr:ABC transporter ATP-binding protein/permease [bacterium]